MGYTIAGKKGWLNGTSSGDSETSKLIEVLTAQNDLLTKQVEAGTKVLSTEALQDNQKPISPNIKVEKNTGITTVIVNSTTGNNKADRPDMSGFVWDQVIHLREQTETQTYFVPADKGVRYVVPKGWRFKVSVWADVRQYHIYANIASAEKAEWVTLGLLVEKFITMESVGILSRGQKFQVNFDLTKVEE